MKLPILYSFRRCPYAIRARMTLLYAGRPVELREVILRDKPVEMLEISPKATVPVLQLKNKILEESLDIMNWALNIADPDDWRRSSSVSLQAEIAVLIDSNDHQFKPLLDQYKYADRYPAQTPQAHQQAASEFPKQLDQRLKAQRFLLDDKLSLADIALFPFIRQFAFVNKDWFDQAPWPNLQRWLQMLLDDPLFSVTMAKHPQWKPGNDDVLTVISVQLGPVAPRR